MLVAFRHEYAPCNHLAVSTPFERRRLAHTSSMGHKAAYVNYTLKYFVVNYTHNIYDVDMSSHRAYGWPMNTRRSVPHTPLLYKRLGTIIKERRRQLGLTQEHLSSQLGISRASLANVETGRQRVLVHQLYQLAEKLDVNVTSLLPDPEETKDLRSLDDLSFSENVSLEQRRQIARLLRADDELSSPSGDQHDTTRRNSKARRRSS